MRFCVVLGTTTVIDGSENPNEVMMLNALSAGYSESEIEILTEEEYQARKSIEPTPPMPPSEIDQLKAENKALKQEIAQTNNDMVGFQNFIFEKFPDLA